MTESMILPMLAIYGPLIVATIVAYALLNRHAVARTPKAHEARRIIRAFSSPSDRTAARH